MDRQQQIWRKVEQMFLRFGIKSVSMDDICRSVGISKKTLYQLVPNKSELIGQILDNHIREECLMVEDLEKKANDPIHAMVLISKYVAKIIMKMSPNTMYDLRKYYRETWKTFEKERNRIILQSIRDNLQQGITEGLYRTDLDPDLLSSLYLRMATFVTDENLEQTPSRRVQLYVEFIRYHIRGISTDKGLETLDKYEDLLKEIA